MKERLEQDILRELNQAKAILEMLNQIVNNKQLTEDEQNERIENALEKSV